MTAVGAIDCHVHAGPSFFERKLDAIELAEAVASSPLGGAILKNHFGSTVPHCRLAAARSPDVDLYPSVTLNEFVGGYHPPTVEAAIADGVRFVWLPTFSAAGYDPDDLDVPPFVTAGSLTVFDDDGDVREEVRRILALVSDADPSPVVGSGHLSPTEVFAVLDIIETHGFDVDYVITHPDFEFVGLTTAGQLELAERGAVVEKCYLPVVTGDVSVETVVEQIREIGADRCLLSTDHGQPTNAVPPVAFERFVDALGESGLTDREIERSAVETPREVLGALR